MAKLGDLVDLVRRQNKDLITETLVGVDINKNLIEEKIKGKKTDLRKLQIVEKGCFVMSGMSVGRDKRVPVALYFGDQPLGASSSNKYYVFKVKDPNLLAEYLNLIFKTSRIDLMGIYLSGQGCRGELTWKNFSQVSISIPSLDKQEKIVHKYQTVTRYIEIKRRINELFEKQMTAYFHILFDELTDYTIKNFGELFTIIRGGRPPRGNLEQEKKYFCKERGIPWLQVRDISRKDYKFVSETSEQLTLEGFRRGRCTMLGGGTLFSATTAVQMLLKK
ncbi:restriction endonuclease subunit S [Mycoplasma wenyonii]|uniref:Restriction endonuclease subunit S n=1 Tax=Mycoplasma wenyonii TaxID=65123 RepID=A0A328PJ39_9MOLU|nr:restriction endonuclease subunit S [Mycoplasma wenyonii]RAO94822.1 restriction endonuclease subunit S [Mycoplasma wenyonii]